MKKVSIGLKVVALLGLTTAVGIGMGLFAFHTMSELNSASEWVTHTYKVLSTFDDIRLSLEMAETGQRGYLITGDESYLEPYKSGSTKAEEKFREVRDMTTDNARQQTRLAGLKTMLDERLAILGQAVTVRRESGFEASKKLVLNGGGRELMSKLRTTIEEGMAEESDLLAKRNATTAGYAESFRWLLIFGGALFIIVFATTAIFVRRAIVDPLTKVMVLANGIANGNLRHEPLNIQSNDEIGELAVIFNSMLAFLREMAKQNIEVAGNLGSAASEILAAIQQQAAAVREQAAAIQQTTTTMEEIGQSGAQVNERGRQVSGSAEATLAAANAGIGAVKNTNQTMVSIRTQVESVAENIVNLSERNQTIGEIIASVNDFAEQSNLLALNAAIEAADAGEHGRRFSVVANEIKNLADQAKGATVQVRSILGQIQKGINTSVMLTEEAVKRAEGGKQQADIAEKTIVQLTGTTNESVRTFQQILGATNQQQIGFEQITQALKSIRIGADQTAASTNQLEKAALSLNNLGQTLQATALRYKT